MSVYRKHWIKPYPNGWKDGPSGGTSVYASYLNNVDTIIGDIDAFLNNMNNSVLAGVQINGLDLQVKEGKVDLPYASRSQAGVIKPDGTTTQVVNGILSVIGGGGGGSSRIDYITQAEYDDLPASKLTDGVLRIIKDRYVMQAYENYEGSRF